MLSHSIKFALVMLPLLCSGCVLEPVDAGPPPPAYGYYGAPAYPWVSSVNVDIGRGYGHGGYGRGGGGYGGGRYGGGGRGWRR